MYRLKARMLFLTVIAILSVPFACAQNFTQTCTNPQFPTPAPAQSLGIDSQCGIKGNGAAAEGLQNAAKNNFCATGQATPMTIAKFTNLQNQVTNKRSINFGNRNTALRKKGPTTDRSPLKTMGESTLVSFQGFVLKARQEGGESVNCGHNVPDDPKFHDIHIALVATKDEKKECSGIVAEMIPHHRPDLWTAENVNKVATAKAPVRVTGQLFFDSSHVPCQGGIASSGNPSRVSLWEIHPIYKFEVCTANCDAAGQWETLDAWAASH